jgi:hypothetical protein
MAAELSKFGEPQDGASASRSRDGERMPAGPHDDDSSAVSTARHHRTLLGGLFLFITFSAGVEPALLMCLTMCAASAQL